MLIHHHWYTYLVLFFQSQRPFVSQGPDSGTFCPTQKDSCMELTVTPKLQTNGIKSTDQSPIPGSWLKYYISRPFCKRLWAFKELSSCWSLISYSKLNWENYAKMSPLSAGPAHCVAGHAPQLWQRASTSDAQTRTAGKGRGAWDSCTCLKGPRDLTCLPIKDGTRLSRVKFRHVFLSQFLGRSLHSWCKEINKC